MPKTLYNLEAYPLVRDHAQPAIQPGEPHEFTDEELAAGITGNWSETDPRAGLADEKAWKARRDKASAELTADAADESPAAEAESDKEN